MAFKPVLHHIERVHVGSKQPDGKAGKRELESGENEGLLQGAPEVQFFLSLIMDVVLLKLELTWNARDMCSKLDDFSLAAIWYADDGVLVVKPMNAAETSVSETIQELESTDLTEGAEKTHWTSFPRLENCCLQVDGE